MSRITQFALKPAPVEMLLTQGSTIKVVDTPSAVRIPTGITEQVKKVASQLGVIVPNFRLVTEQSPTLELTMPNLTPEIVGLLIGNKIASIPSVATFYGKNRLLLKTGSIPAAPVGGEGHGLIADQALSIASVFEDGLSLPLTRVNFGAFAAATPNTFAQGNDGAYLFSTNLINSEVSFRTPQPLTNIQGLTEDPSGVFGCTLVLLDTQLAVVTIDIPEIQFILDGVTLDFAAESQSLRAQINYDGSGCLPFYVYYKGQKRAC